MTLKEELGVASFQRFLDQKKLVGARCLRCGTLYVPPRPLCSRCHGAEMSWQELSGRGRLVGFTAINVVLSRMLKEGYGRENPYLTGIVALAEGPRIAARLVGSDPGKPGEIRIGAALRAVFLEQEENGKVRVNLAFRLSSRRRKPRDDKG